MVHRGQSILPLIAGAGPVGLGAALLLARDGIPTRLIDMAENPTPYSKALAVNPRTLDILEPTGVTQKMLEIGVRIRGASFWRRGTMIAQLSFADLPHKHPYMLALSQASTERLLANALEAAGGSVERGVTLMTCSNDGTGVEVALTLRSGAQVTAHVPWILAADGAHSTARQALKVQFHGTSFNKKWYLADVPLATALSPEWAHVLFLDEGGFLFLIRVVDDKLSSSSGDPLWRVMGNVPQPLDHLTHAEVTGSPVWSSDFHISHRINSRLQVGHVYLAGDAAHVHSPVGARGMNLGLEDVWVFSRLVKTHEMPRYEQLRRSVDHRVVRRVEQFSRLARGESVISRTVRAYLLPQLLKIDAARNRIAGIVTGLDHALPAL